MNDYSLTSHRQYLSHIVARTLKYFYHFKIYWLYDIQVHIVEFYVELCQHKGVFQKRRNKGYNYREMAVIKSK